MSFARRPGVDLPPVSVTQVTIADPDGSRVVAVASGSVESTPAVPPLVKFQAPAATLPGGGGGGAGAQVPAVRETWDVLRDDRVAAFRRTRQKQRLNQILLGQPSFAVAGFGADANRSTSPTTPPSWTQASLGLSHGSVIQPLSSSRHEQQNLNAFVSGTAPLEATAVPGSGTLYYTKLSPLQRKTYYHYPDPVQFAASPGDFNGVSASWTNTLGPSRPEYVLHGIYYSDVPATGSYFRVPIDVPERGRLVDVRVWVELYFSGSTSYASLSNLFLGLRSPHVKGFGSGHPIRNDALYPSPGKADAPHLIDTFILWEGAGTYAGVTAAKFAWDPAGERARQTWNKDFAMRTVFWDSAPVENPRHLEKVRNGSVKNAINLSGSAPNTVFGGTLNGNGLGANVPWYAMSASSNVPGTGSPPAGWLTGPGGSAVSGTEWATSGTQYGPAEIKPVYPMLDRVYCQKYDPLYWTLLNVPSPTFTSQFFSSQPRWRGDRPGLRDSQIQGRWELIVMAGSGTMEIRVRQFRLELTYDANVGVSLPRTSSARPRRGAGARGAFPRVWNVISGSGFTEDGSGNPTGDYDIWPSLIWVPANPASSVNRTFGITDDTGSVDYAVFTRPIGIMTGSDQAAARIQYLQNEFGTPYIPLSSGSTATAEFLAQLSSSVSQVDDYFNPRPAIGAGRTLWEVVRLGRRTGSIV